MKVNKERDIIKLYREGKKYKDIYHILNTSSKTIKECLIKNNIPIKNPEDYIIFKKGFSSREDRDKKIIELHNKGMSQYEIHKKLNIGENTVLRCLKRNNIDSKKGARFGYIFSEERKLKHGLIRKGKRLSEESKKKMSDTRRKLIIDGKIDITKNIRLMQKLNIGRKHSVDFCNKIRLRNVGRKYPKDLYPHMGLRKTREYIIIPKQDSSIEIKIQNYLKELKIGFFTHYYCKEIEHSYQCDIFIPVQRSKDFFIKQPIIIECDGDYWHCNTNLVKNPNKKQLERIKLDSIRTQELEAKGFRVIRLWESDIKVIDICKIKEKLGVNH